jgi:leader peptidase (prepilin peptidase)/N-methyltransferase
VSVALPELLMKAAFGCLLVALIVRLAIIDCREMILPDRLNAMLAAGGAAHAILLGQPGLVDAIAGAVVGFLTLVVVAAVFRRTRGIEGLGFGDQKFAAAAGLWIGWEGVAPMLLIASLSALAFVGVRAATALQFDMAARVPFGPFLSLGTVVCWLMMVGS